MNYATGSTNNPEEQRHHSPITDDINISWRDLLSHAGHTLVLTGGGIDQSSVAARAKVTWRRREFSCILVIRFLARSVTCDNHAFVPKQGGGRGTKSHSTLFEYVGW